MLFENILEAIGNTPLVKLNRINPFKKVAICAKLEGFNPSGSIKDRIVLKMIEQAKVEDSSDNAKNVQIDHLAPEQTDHPKRAILMFKM